MRFSKQPNGKWCGYSKISASFYETELDDMQLVAAVMRDIVSIDSACEKIPQPDDMEELTDYLKSVANRCAGRVLSLLSDGGYNFDDITNEFRYYNDKKKTREFWVKKFKYLGCNDDQMRLVQAQLDFLESQGDLCDM